jgi:hypothetical protein
MSLIFVASLDARIARPDDTFDRAAVFSGVVPP